MPTRASSDRRVDWFIATIFALGATAFTASFYLQPVSDPVGVGLVIIMSAASELLGMRLYFDGRVSVGFVILVFAILSLGASGGALAAAAVAVSCYVVERAPQKLAFNFGQQNVAALVGAGAAAAIGISATTDSAAVLLAGGAAAALVVFVATSFAVSTIMAITSGRTILRTFRSNFAWLLPHYVALGLVGGGLAFAYHRLGVPAVLLMSLPLLLSRYSMKQVLDKTRDNVLRLERSNEQLQHSYAEISQMSEELRVAYTGTLESLVAALDVRDQETRGHSMRVATHSLGIAKLMGLTSEEELGIIYRGALMHDVGKIGVPDAILRKPSKLSEEEWDFMRKHPAMGYRILAQVPYLRPAARIVLAHHERWDGNGYPRRLRGEDIPLGARIFAICDTYDAIVSDRPYRRGQDPDAAFREILRCAGTQFDPKVVEAFEALFPAWREEAVDSATRPLYLPSWVRKERDASTRAAG